jgi:hypothetical protein
LAAFALSRGKATATPPITTLRAAPRPGCAAQDPSSRPSSIFSNVPGKDPASQLTLSCLLRPRTHHYKVAASCC